jgi:hypothetical protein
MRRRNGKVIVGLALVLLAVAAIMPVTAQAKPTSVSTSTGVTPDDRSLARSMLVDRSEYPAWAAQIETPYWFSTSAGMTPDDRSLARSMSVDSTPTVVANDGGRSIDFNGYTVTGVVLLLLLAIGGGMAAGLLYGRRTKLSPA